MIPDSPPALTLSSVLDVGTEVAEHDTGVGLVGAQGPYPRAEESKIPNTSSRMEGRYFRAAPCRDTRELPLNRAPTSTLWTQSSLHQLCFLQLPVPAWMQGTRPGQIQDGDNPQEPFSDFFPCRFQHRLQPGQRLPSATELLTPLHTTAPVQ